MPSSTAGGGVERPSQEGAAAAPLLRLPTAPDKGTKGTREESQSGEYLEGNCDCHCGGSKVTTVDGLESRREAGGSEGAVTIAVEVGESGGCHGANCRRNRKNKEGKEDTSDPLTPGGRVRPVITFSHVEGGGHKGSEGRDNRSRSPSPLLEIPTPVDTSKEIMRPPSAERT